MSGCEQRHQSVLAVSRQHPCRLERRQSNRHFSRKVVEQLLGLPLLQLHSHSPFADNMVSAESSEIPRSVVDEKASEHKVDVGPPSAGILTSQSWRGAVCVFCGSSTGNDPEFEVREKCRLGWLQSLTCSCYDDDLRSWRLNKSEKPWPNINTHCKLREDCVN